MEITAINNNEEYKKALTRIEELFDSKPGSKDYEELKALSEIVDDYEDSLCNNDDDDV